MQSSGETTIHVFRQELGQHIGTAFAQIIAEELELDWSKVSIDYLSGCRLMRPSSLKQAFN